MGFYILTVDLKMYPIKTEEKLLFDETETKSNDHLGRYKGLI